MTQNKKLYEAEEALLDFVIRVSTKGSSDPMEVKVLPEVAKVAFENKAWLKD